MNMEWIVPTDQNVDYTLRNGIISGYVQTLIIIGAPLKTLNNSNLDSRYNSSIHKYRVNKHNCHLTSSNAMHREAINITIVTHLLCHLNSPGD